MRYQFLAFTALLLSATPIFAQERSPIVIETGDPTPSTVRSGEPFQVTYTAKFYDEVRIIEEQMQPENIVAEPFEVLDLKIDSLPDEGDENTGIIHVKEFIYTFRIIKPEKGEKKIPAFKFIWVIKKAGTMEADAKESNELHEMSTDEVSIRYVYSPVGQPNLGLTIRDLIVFSKFSVTGTGLRRYAYGFAGISLASLFTLVFMLVKRTRTRKVSENAGENTNNEEAGPEIPSDVLPKKAGKKFIKELNKLLKTGDIESSPRLEKHVHDILREFLLAELSAPPIKALNSDTPRDLVMRLRSLDDEQKEKMEKRYRNYVYLADRLAFYYQDIESGKLNYFTNPKLDLLSLRSSALRIRKMSFWNKLLKLLGVSNAG